jgi:hypothetical protein
LPLRKEKASYETEVRENARSQNERHGEEQIKANLVSQPSQKEGDHGVGHEPRKKHEVVKLAFQAASNAPKDRVQAGKACDSEVLPAHPRYETHVKDQGEQESDKQAEERDQDHFWTFGTFARRKFVLPE